MTDRVAKRIAELIAPLRVEPGTRVRLPRHHDPAYTGPLENKQDGAELLQRGVILLTEFQARLAAEKRNGLLVVLQGPDAAGKDGTIRHVMSGVNPQGVHVHSFKVPSAEELDHDYLWRFAQRLPGRGEIAIFNRSHYEDVLVVRVHPELLDGQKLPSTSSRIWKQRFRAINDWERHLTDNGFQVVKLFLNLSRDEQRDRLLDRIDRPEKNWKFSAADLRERQSWDAYQSAYSEMLSNTSTPWAPWHVIPADRKWFARLAAAAVIADALITLDPQYPTVEESTRRELLCARTTLRAEG
jgi:PPK2 family polyphosphate:nucleotide phosphotransferase